ncbi:MAG: hypothetical protein WCE64_10550 [Bacteroidales bacterium]
MTTYTSRTGNLSCTPPAVFEFITDIRNFKQFIPDQNTEALQIDRDSCTFNVPNLGEIKLRLAEKEPFSNVVYSGTALGSYEYSLVFKLSEGRTGKASVQVTMTAEMNPLLKMMVSKPIAQFLEMLVVRMEEFDGWKETTR